MSLKQKYLIGKLSVSGLLVPVGFIGFFFVLYIRKHGLLLAYMNSSGYIGFLVALLLTLTVGSILENRLTGKAFWVFHSARSFWGILFWGVTFYTYATVSDLALKKITGLPDYVLFPCSSPPSSEIALEQAKEFWKLNSHQDFECAPNTDSLRSEWWICTYHEHWRFNFSRPQ